MNFFTVALDLNNTIRGVNTQMVTYIHCISRSFARLISLHFTEVPFTYPWQVVFYINCNTGNRCPNTLFVLDHFLVGMRTLPYGFLAAFDPVSPTSYGNCTKPFIQLSYSQALTNAVRELINKSRSEKVSTKAQIEFAENPEILAATTSGAERQSGSNMELGLNIVGENVNENGQRGVEGVEVEKVGVIGQDLEEHNPEFLKIEKQF